MSGSNNNTRYCYVDLDKLKAYLSTTESPEFRAFVVDLCRDVLLHKVSGGNTTEETPSAIYRRQQAIESLQRTGVISFREGNA